MEQILNKTAYDFSKKSDIIQTVIIGLLAFLVPTFLAKLIEVAFGATSVIANNSQIIVGSIVNTALVVSAINLKGWKKILFVVTMPSISTILSGYVFKSASVFMVYMIPAIWLGNFALIYSYKYFMLEKKMNYFLAGIIGIAIKVAIIYGAFLALNGLNIFPEKVALMLQKAMSLIQLITASIGVILAYGIYKIEKKEIKK